MVSAIGLGCMGVSDFYGPPDESESIDESRIASVAELEEETGGQGIPWPRPARWNQIYG